MDKEVIKKKVERLVNHFKAGDYNYTIKETQILLKKLPDNIFLINLMGSCYQNIGDLKMAANAFVYIIGLDKKNTAAYNNLGNVFKTQKKFEEAKDNYSKALEINPTFINAIINLGNLYFELNDFKNATDHYLKAIEIDNKNALAHYNLGLVYQSIGEFENSKKEFEEVLKINPVNTNADKMISRFTKYTLDNNHLKKMEEKLRNLKLNDAQKINLFFSLGKAYEDIKNYEKSFEFIKKANDTKKKLINRDFKNDFKTFSNLKSFFKDYNLSSDYEYDKDKKIIFIVGLPRSGTSLIEQIISSHSKVHGCGELDYINKIVRNNFYNQDVLNKSKLDNLDNTKIKKLTKSYMDLVEKFDSQSKVFTDKAPLNFAWIGIIKILFPNSKIVHCSRNPKDNILSLYKNDFDDRLNFTYDFDDLEIFYKEYLELIDFWKSKFGNQIYDANYEKFLENPEEEIKKLLSFCDIDYEENCLNFHETKRPIKTVSSAQARKPIYKSSILSYQKYEKYMKDIFDKLG
tara:strand:+ start:154 stop:1704 length:1551 start_codon:yes stop_codon:yes gene_type:complete